MVKIKNLAGDTYSGKAGKSAVYATWKGIQYRRKYVIPANPRTVKQVSIRTKFTNAVSTWHTFNTIQRLAYKFLAAGEAMSGFNKFVSRWQQANPPAIPYPSPPLWGMIQVATAQTAVTDEAVPNSKGPNSFAKYPVRTGSVSWDKGSSTLDLHAYVEIENGLVIVAKNITGTLKISYKAGGREVVGEEVATNPTAGSKYHLKNYDIDLTSVKVYVGDTEVDGIAISLKQGKYYFTKSAPGVTNSTMDYIALTDVNGASKVVEGAKLETYFANTSQVAFRAYTDSHGCLFLAATVEDELYDLKLEYPGFATIIEAGKTAAQIVADRAYILE